jgi:glutaredoxin
MLKVVLYTRVGCHLCDDALALLRQYGLEPQLIDIDADPALLKQFNECAPVVEIDGKVRFRGRINEVLLSRLVANQAGSNN